MKRRKTHMTAHDAVKLGCRYWLGQILSTGIWSARHV